MNIIYRTFYICLKLTLLKKIVFLLFLSTGFLFAQNPYYIPIDNSSGLPSNSIYDIFQDSKGFMWFATGKGLCRYDGNFTKTYTSEFQTSKSGSCIQEDIYGRVWYENFDGFLYYVENDELKTIQQTKPLGYFRYGITKKFLLVLESDGVRFYDLKTLKPIKKVALKLNFLSFVYNSDDKLYVLDDKFYEIDDVGIVKSYEYPINFKSDFNAPILQKHNNGIVIISKFSNKYYYFENGKFEKKEFPFLVDFIQNLATTTNNIWLCTTKGVIKFNTQTLEYKNYFSNKNISFIYLDKQNNYWISTINEGVYFIENFDTKIIELPSKPTVLSKSKTELLVGTENERLFSINPNNLSYKSIYKGELNHIVNQLFQDESSENTYFTSSGLKILKNSKVKDLKFGAVKSITKIDDKYFSFAASNASGVFTNKRNSKSKWDIVFKKYDKIKIDDFDRLNLVVFSNGKSTVYNPKNETIYFATNTGLIDFSEKGSNEIKYKNETIYFVKLDYYNGMLYGFSSNEKIYTINAKNEIKPYILPDNLVKDKIERISLKDHFLFFFTSDAVYELDLENNALRKILTLTKGIDITSVEILNDEYYFASSKGIIIKSDATNKVNFAPKLFINKITVNDEKNSLKNNSKLSYSENNIKINFTVLSHIPNEKYKVLYSINNSKWNVLEAENRNLILSSLAPNDYEIRLKIDDKNCASIETINFNIAKPFWLNPFLLSAIAILLLLILYSLYKWQICKIEQKNKLELDKINLEKNVNQSKLKAIKSQMNPHFFYNALNTLQSYILSNEKKQAVDYLSKFSNLTRTILEMTEKDFISVSDEIKTLRLYLDIEKARFEEDFTYEIHTNSASDNDLIKIPTMLLQPYVENAIKHGLLHKQGKKELHISFEKTNDIVTITIDDNGIGRQKSTKLNAIKNKNHISFATEATQNRIDLLNQYTHKNISIVIVDKTNPLEQSLGTTVILEIPISY